LRNPELRRAADGYDRAARARHGVVPAGTREGNQLRAAARLLAMTGALTGDTMLLTAVLAANLVALAVAVTELREAQQHAGQAAAARAAAEHLRAATRNRSPPGRKPGRDRGGPPLHALPSAMSRHQPGWARLRGQELRRPVGLLTVGRCRPGVRAGPVIDPALVLAAPVSLTGRRGARWSARSGAGSRGRC
jgi:hypothetical protein